MNSDNQLSTFQWLKNHLHVDPLADLTPKQADLLLYGAYHKSSPVQFRQEISDEVLDQIPLFRTLEAFLHIVHREKQIELAPLDTLPQSLLVEVYEKGFIRDPFIDQGVIPIVTEDNCEAIMTAGMTAEVAGFVENIGNRQQLTQLGLDLLKPSKRQELFVKFFKAFTDEFPWSILDAHPQEPIAQLGWAYSVLLLHHFGEIYLPVSFYAATFFTAFPDFTKYFESKPYSFTYAAACYNVRTFNRFLLWFGMITLVEDISGYTVDQDAVKFTPILNAVFRFHLEI